MKKKRFELRSFLCVCAALGWWGFLYPQLTLTQDTYKIVYEDEAQQESPEKEEWDFDSDIFEKILGAKERYVCAVSFSQCLRPILRRESNDTGNNRGACKGCAHWGV